MPVGAFFADVEAGEPAGGHLADANADALAVMRTFDAVRDPELRRSLRQLLTSVVRNGGGSS